MITREADYAMRVALHLAAIRSDGRDTASCAEVARDMGVPYRFLRKIVRRMVASGLILSSRGRGGGLSLAKLPRHISLLDVIGAMGETGVTLSRCLAPGGGCVRTKGCRIHDELHALQRTVDKRLAALSLDRLL